MGKIIVRLAIVCVAIYLIIAYILAQFVGIDILTNTYTLAFELCVVIYAYSEGKYHCRFIKHTMLSIFISDTMVRLNYLFDVIPSVSFGNYLCGGIVAIGTIISLTKAIIHFYKVRKLKTKRNERRQEGIIGNQTDGNKSD